MLTEITINSTGIVHEGESLRVRNRLSPRGATAEFRVISGVIPAEEDEVQITRAATPMINCAIALGPAMGGKSTYINNFFGGYISDVEPVDVGTGLQYLCSAYDYQQRLFNGILVNKTYSSKTEAEILTDLFSEYWGDVDAGTYVTGPETIASIQFLNIYLGDALDQLAELNGRKWYLDYDKKLHYSTPAEDTAPFELSDTPALTKYIGYHDFKYRITRPTCNRAVVIGRDDLGADIEVTRTNAASYAAYGRYFDRKHTDRNINTQAWAEAVGDAITDVEGVAKESGSLKINQEGLVVGQKVKITNARRSIDEYYLVQAVDMRVIATLPEVTITYGDYVQNVVDKIAAIAGLQQDTRNLSV